MSESDPLHEELDRLTDRVTARLTESSPHDAREHRVPPADVVETPTTFVVVLDLPGYDPATVDARVTDNVLHVAAQPKYGTDLEDASADYLRRERDRQPASRRIALPQEVDETESSADYTDGVLTVTLSKDEEEQPGHYLDID